MIRFFDLLTLGKKLQCYINGKKVIIIFIALWQMFMLVSLEKEPIEMVKIPGKNYKMSTTEITQKFYESVMGVNPSKFKSKGKNKAKSENMPVEMVSWYDAIYFCNKLSIKCGYTPVYSINVLGYTPHTGSMVDGEISQNISADGFRLPTKEEWEYAAKGGQDYKYAGSDNIDEVAWFKENSKETTHPVGLKKANGYGLYDMSGNVFEWCWDSTDSGIRCFRGGSWNIPAGCCSVIFEDYYFASSRYYHFGFRVVRTVK